MDNCRYLLCGILIVGCFLTKVNAKPNNSPVDHQNHSNDDQVMQPDDYSYVDETESQSAEPTSSSTATNVMSPISPFFPEKESKRYAKVGDINVTLPCNAKNLSESNVILWYKNKNVVSNGPVVSDSIYRISKNNDLIIPIMTKELFGDYFCHVHPQNIQSHIALIVGNYNDNHNHNHNHDNDHNLDDNDNNEIENKNDAKERMNSGEPEQPKLEQPQAKTDEKINSSGISIQLHSTLMIAICYFITATEYN